MSAQATLILPEPQTLQKSYRHPDDVPPLTMEGMFFPLGFPLSIRTNSEEVLRQSARKWGMFSRRSHDKPIEADIHVIETDSLDCPPEVA